MTKSRTEEVLDGWREAAHAASPPTEAPVPSDSLRLTFMSGVLGVVVVAIALALRAGTFAGAESSLGSSSSPTASAMATPSVSIENGLPVSIAGERVYHGDAIIDRRMQGGSFLVTGRLAPTVFDCRSGSCPGGTVWMLVDPTSSKPTVLPLLSGGKVWTPDETARWEGNLVVLRVHAYQETCPWNTFCEGALLVEEAVSPEPGTDG